MHNFLLFKDIGCFDEDFVGSRSGGYGIFDNYFTETVIRCNYGMCLITGPRMVEWMEDIMGPNVQQKTGVDRHVIRVNRGVWRAKKKAWPEDLSQKPDVNLPIIRFKWEKT